MTGIPPTPLELLPPLLADLAASIAGPGRLTRAQVAAELIADGIASPAGEPATVEATQAYARELIRQAQHDALPAIEHASDQHPEAARAAALLLRRCLRFAQLTIELRPGELHELAADQEHAHAARIDQTTAELPDLDPSVRAELDEIARADRDHARRLLELAALLAHEADPDNEDDEPAI